MKKQLLLASATILLVLNGCSQKAPNMGNVSDSSHIAGDTVSIDESGYGSGSYNSSSDGFKSIYFKFDDYEIHSDMQQNMNTNVSVAMSASSKVKIEGNCDEFGTDEYNYALGLKRAKAVKETHPLFGGFVSLSCLFCNHLIAMSGNVEVQILCLHQIKLDGRGLQNPQHPFNHIE